MSDERFYGDNPFGIYHFGDKRFNSIFSEGELVQNLYEVCDATLLKGVNDQDKHVNELAKLIRGMNAYVNLIPYNETNNIDFKRSSTIQIMKFYDILKKNSVNVTIRREFGSKISAACGQLRSKKEEV